MASTDPTQTPILPPPPGLTTNFVNPPTLMPAVIVGTTIIHLFTLPFILARAYVNAYVMKACCIEDYLSYISYVGCIAYTAAIVHAETVGMARHMWDISMVTFTEISYICNIVFVCYTATSGLAKTVVFLQLKKIFTTRFRGVVFWVIVGSLIANALFYTAMFFLYVFTCWPREKIWKPSIEGKCIDSNKLNMAMGTLNVISDVEAFVVPVWAIWKLSMKLQRKIAVLAIFGVGAIAVAIGCVGLYYRVILLQQSDFSWLLTQAGLICMAELAIVIIVGCCPYVPRVKNHLRPSSTPESYENSKRTPVPLKQRSKFYHLEKYLDTNASVSNPGSSVSEEHLELHQYCETKSKYRPKGFGGDDRVIMRTTHVEQSVS